MDDQTLKELRSEWDDALSAIETALEERPGKHTGDISHAMNDLIRVRDRLIEVQRSPTPSPKAAEHLQQVNSMLSVVASLEYPLAGLRWQRAELVRNGLEKMLKRSSDAA
jgi:hypothetical protein